MDKETFLKSEKAFEASRMADKIIRQLEQAGDLTDLVRPRVFFLANEEGFKQLRDRMLTEALKNKAAADAHFASIGQPVETAFPGWVETQRETERSFTPDYVRGMQFVAVPMSFRQRLWSGIKKAIVDALTGGQGGRAQ